jgi:glycolate oxidase iron-sulfur subunit
MDAWLRDTHRATARVMRAAGATVARPPVTGACCGALHVHAGRAREAHRLARRVIASMPGDAPVVVNSAGCGTAMKEYGAWLGTPEAQAFSARVRDFAEWVAAAGIPPLRSRPIRVVVQDPCHLRHVQKTHTAVRTVLAPAYDLVETADDGLCCGAGGAYAVTQPELSARILERKLEALRAAADTECPIVASANPGCMVQLRRAGIDARHPADLLAEALDV